VLVPPIPILLLLVFFQFAIVPVNVSVGLTHPPVVIHPLVIVPNVIVGVVRVVGPIANADADAGGATDAEYRLHKSSSDKNRTAKAFLRTNR
jgi:hypothetical protein